MTLGHTFCARRKIFSSGHPSWPGSFGFQVKHFDLSHQWRLLASGQIFWPGPLGRPCRRPRPGAASGAGAASGRSRSSSASAQRRNENTRRRLLLEPYARRTHRPQIYSMHTVSHDTDHDSLHAATLLRCLAYTTTARGVVRAAHQLATDKATRPWPHGPPVHSTRLSRKPPPPHGHGSCPHGP